MVAVAAVRLREEVDGALLRSTGVETSLFTVTIAGSCSSASNGQAASSSRPLLLLLPDAQYQVRYSVVYDQHESPASAYSAVFRTAPLAVPSPPLPVIAVSSSAASTTAATGSDGGAGGNNKNSIEFSVRWWQGRLAGQHERSEGRQIGVLKFTWPAGE